MSDIKRASPADRTGEDRRWRSVAPVAITAAWLVVLPRAVPSLSLDHGIFASVAERLLAGDRLYSGVWDNKDPLFYWILALGRSVSPLSEVVLELIWLVTACAAVRSIVGRITGRGQAPIIAGFAVTPVVLTGGVYQPGHSHLPAVAIGLVSLAAAAAHRPTLSGGLLGLVLGLKLILAPVVALPVAACLILRRDGTGLIRAAIGFAATALAVIAALAARGELMPYLATQRHNLAYSQGSSLETSLPFPVAHLARVATQDSIASVLTTTAVLVLSRGAALRGRPPARSLWWGALSAFGGAVAVLAATGIWEQHAQVLLLPAALAGALVVVSVRDRIRIPDGRSVARLGGAAVVLAATAAALGGPQTLGYIRSFHDAPTRIAHLMQLPLEAKALLDSGSPSGYARVGSNDDGGHAFGLRRWHLVCPRFHQYSFDPPAELSRDVECLKRAEYVIVAPSARDEPGQAAWNAYISDVRALLRRDFTCAPHADATICRRVRGAPTSM